MLSKPQAMNAGQAGGYFSKEDYYLRDAELGGNSQWCGEGARALGLEGAVREEEFRALCRGEEPGGNRIVSYKLTYDKETGLPDEKHRAGNDCTFSARKVGIDCLCRRGRRGQGCPRRCAALDSGAPGEALLLLPAPRMAAARQLGPLLRTMKPA